MRTKTRLITLSARYLAAALVLGLPALAQCIPFMETLAWARDYVGNPVNQNGGIDVDSSGDSFVWNAAVGASSTALVLEKITPYGVQTFASAGVFTKATANFVKVAPDNTVFVAGTYYHDVNTPGQLYVARYTNTLHKMWELKFFNQLVPTQIPVGLGVDNSENVWIPFEQAAGIIGPTPALEIDEINAAGNNDTLVAFDQGMDPKSAQFYGGRWYVVGSDTTASSPGGARWAVYSSAPAMSALFGGTKANGNFMNDTDYYNFILGPGPNQLVVVTQLTHQFTNDTTTHNRYYSIDTYDSSGTHVKFFTTYAGEIVQVVNGGATAPVYMAGYENGTTATLGLPVVYQFNNDLAMAYNWKNYSNVQSLLPVTGFGLFGVGTEITNAHAWEYCLNSSTGATMWSNSFSGTTVGVSQPALANSSLNHLFVATVIHNAANSPVEVRQFVPGINLSYLKSSATSVTSGGQVTITVGLNYAAPTGGYVVNLTSGSAKLLFTSNNSQASSITVPAGHLTATFTMSAGTVAANTLVSVIGRQNGIVRNVYVTVKP